MCFSSHQYLVLTFLFFILYKFMKTNNKTNHPIYTFLQKNDNIFSFFLFFSFFAGDVIYGISTIVGYLMPNAVYTYILNVI